MNKADPTVIRNKIYGNKKAGVVVTQDGKGTFDSNEIYNNSGGGFCITQRENPVMKNNDIHDNEDGILSLFHSIHSKSNRYCRIRRYETMCGQLRVYV